MSILKTRFNLSAQESGATGESGEGRSSVLAGLCEGGLTFCCFACSLVAGTIRFRIFAFGAKAPW